MLRATRRAETTAARSAATALCHAQVILGLIHRIGLVKHVCHRRPEGVRNNAAHACKSDIRACGCPAGSARATAAVAGVAPATTAVVALVRIVNLETMHDGDLPTFSMRASCGRWSEQTRFGQYRDAPRPECRDGRRRPNRLAKAVHKIRRQHSPGGIVHSSSSQRKR